MRGGITEGFREPGWAISPRCRPVTSSGPTICSTIHHCYATEYLASSFLAMGCYVSLERYEWASSASTIPHCGQASSAYVWGCYEE